MLCVLLCAAFFLQVLLVGLTTFNVAAQNTLSKEIQVLNSQIGDLEAQYITLSGDISRKHAFALGFKEPQKEIFAFRKRLVQNSVSAF